MNKKIMRVVTLVCFLFALFPYATTPQNPTTKTIVTIQAPLVVGPNAILSDISKENVVLFTVEMKQNVVKSSGLEEPKKKKKKKEKEKEKVNMVKETKKTEKPKETKKSKQKKSRGKKSDKQFISVDSTAYYNSNNSYCADGTWPTPGVLAGKREWLGRSVKLYDKNKKYMGTYTFHDVGYGQSTGYGKSRLLKGKTLGTIETGECIDIFFNTYNECISYGRRRVYMVWID